MRNELYLSSKLAGEHLSSLSAFRDGQRYFCVLNQKNESIERACGAIQRNGYFGAHPVGNSEETEKASSFRDTIPPQLTKQLSQQTDVDTILPESAKANRDACALTDARHS